MLSRMSEKSLMKEEPQEVAALYARVSTLDQNCEVQREIAQALNVPVSRVRRALLRLPAKTV